MLLKVFYGAEGTLKSFPKGPTALQTKSKARDIKSSLKTSSTDKILRGHMETLRLLLISIQSGAIMRPD